MSKLIIENMEFGAVETLVEEVAGKKRMYIEGIYLQGAIRNRNGRIYPMGILENEVNRYLREAVEVGSGWGELSHPASPTINPDRIAHRIVELRKDGNNYIGKSILVTENPCGAIVAGLLNSGGKVGVSSRGMGSLKDAGGIMEVQSDFRLSTAADVVLDPSAPDAFVNGIMEGVNWVQKPDGDWIQEKIQDAKTEIQKLSLSQISERKTDLFRSFLKGLVEK